MVYYGPPVPYFIGWRKPLTAMVQHLTSPTALRRKKKHLTLGDTISAQGAFAASAVALQGSRKVF